jgi:hypothetical protein
MFIPRINQIIRMPKTPNGQDYVHTPPFIFPASAIQNSQFNFVESLFCRRKRIQMDGICQMKESDGMVWRHLVTQRDKSCVTATPQILGLRRSSRLTSRRHPPNKSPAHPQPCPFKLKSLDSSSFAEHSQQSRSRCRLTSCSSLRTPHQADRDRSASNPTPAKSNWKSTFRSCEEADG